jgi:hypothetical protein
MVGNLFFPVNLSLFHFSLSLQTPRWQPHRCTRLKTAENHELVKTTVTVQKQKPTPTVNRTGPPILRSLRGRDSGTNFLGPAPLCINLTEFKSRVFIDWRGEDGNLRNNCSQERTIRNIFIFFNHNSSLTFTKSLDDYQLTTYNVLRAM